MKTKTKLSILFIVQAGVIAALYVVLTFLSHLAGLDSGVIQVRISEALCILSAFTPAAIPGLTIGCFLSNLINGCVWQDILFGTLATFLGALLGYLLRKVSVWLVPVPTVLANALIVPFVLVYAYGVPDAWWFCFLTVGAGELIAAFALGMILYFAARKPLEKVLSLRY
ncbi:MAG: QueT transporter family protein [Ruminococcaceae bacterium]|nr:QueT transporter family protein [Oscillospiraceae bacterium]